jgi:hypothetical protein
MNFEDASKIKKKIIANERTQPSRNGTALLTERKLIIWTPKNEGESKSIVIYVNRP